MITNNVYDIALSGLQAAQTQMQVASNNIANMDTPGYQAQRVDLVDLSGGGVAVSGITSDSSSQDQDGNNVDPATESVNLMKAKLLYTANAAVINVQNQMTGTLLNILDNDRDSDSNSDSD